MYTYIFIHLHVYNAYDIYLFILHILYSVYFLNIYITNATRCIWCTNKSEAKPLKNINLNPAFS